MNEESAAFGIIQTNKETADMATSILLNYGIGSSKIDPHTIQSEKDIPSGIKFLFVDFDFSENASLTALKQIKNGKEVFPFLLIGTSFNATPSLISSLEQYNLIAFLIKPVTADIFRQKVKKIIDRYADHFPERKHIRIKPDPDESMRISFRKGNKYYSGKVLDISLGGLAAEIYSNSDDLQINEHEFLEEITLNLGLREYIFPAETIMIRAKFMSIKFVNIKQLEYEALSKYILSKMKL